MKEVVHRENHVSSDKPCASPSPFNSPLLPVENSPMQSRSSTDGSFRSPFLITAPPDVFNSPSVKCSKSVEISRRRPSPFPSHPEHYSKKMKLSSSDLPDSGSSPPECSMSLPLVTNNTSPSQAVLSPLSPIRSPTADETSNSVLPEMQSVSSELDALLAPVIDSSQVNSPPQLVNAPDSQVNSSGVCEPGSPTPSVTTPLSLQLPSSPSLSPPEDSLPPELHSPDRHTPESPESPASLSSPVVSSPPPDLQAYSVPAQEPVEPEIHHSSLPSQPESEVCSSTTLPGSAADSPSSDLSHVKSELLDDDTEIESGETSFESADTAEATAEAKETCCISEMSCSTSTNGNIFGYFKVQDVPKK